jgi:hypothetical protein
VKPLNILIGMEFSGVVRQAFRRRGHNAFSNDLLPAEDGSPYHLNGHVKYALAENNGFYFPRLGGHTHWDLAIFHPPCTRLTNAGVRWLYTGGRGTVRDPQKWQELREGAALFELCLGRTGDLVLQDVPRRAVENPIMHEHAAELINRPADQIIQPWMFGHREMKATCLWLHNLSKLEPTDNVGPPPKDPVERRKWARVHRESPGPDRWKNRSRTYFGIAEAMAEQWGCLTMERAA